MTKKMILLAVVAVFLGNGIFLFAGAQTTSPSNFSAQSISACSVNLSWDQAQPAPGTFRLVRQILPGGTQEFNLPALAPGGANGISYSCADNKFTQNVSAGGGCGASNWDGYAPNSSISYQIKYCPPSGSCSPASPNPAVNVSTLALPSSPARVVSPASSAAFWHPQGTFAYVESYANGSRITFNFRSDPARPLSSKFKQYGGFILDRSSGSGSDAGFPKFVPASSATDLGNNNFSFSYLDNVGSNVSYTYTVKLYESDQYCKPTSNSAQYSASEPVSVTVPTKPTNFMGTVQGGQNVAVHLSWNKPVGANKFTIVRSRSSDFPLGSNGTTIMAAGVSASSYIDSDNLNSFTTYYYGIAACSDSGGCSAVTPLKVTTGASIFDPKALIRSISGNVATVLITWSTAGDFSNIWVDRTRSGEKVPTTLSCPDSLNNYCIDTNVPMGQSYFYQVKGESPAPVRNSDVFPLSLNLKLINGWGYGFTQPASENETHGIGWIRLSNDSQNSVWSEFAQDVSANPPSNLANDSTQYGLMVDKESGLISGSAWSGLKCESGENRPAGDACGYGWLDFGSNAGCPSGNCEARVQSNGAVTGWAKFTAADSGLGAWDGWVSLRGSEYGLCYGGVADANGLTCRNDGETNSTLNGWAWGNDVTGWLNFGVLIPPVITNISSNCSGTGSTACSATITWNNPMDYKRVDVFQGPKDYSGNVKSYFQGTEDENLDHAPNISKGDNNTVTVQHLASDAKYSFFLKAYPQ